jgi:MFS family permease
MSLLALAGTLAKGATGALTERVSPRFLLVAGLALQFVAVAVLSVTTTPAWAILCSLLFGVGWGLSWLSAHILLLRYFGASLATDLIAMATTATTFAVLGPLSAGWIADRAGSYVPIFAIFAGLLALAGVVSAVLLRAPDARRSEAPVRDVLPEAEIVPAE